MLSILSCKTAEDNCNIQYVHAQALLQYSSSSSPHRMRHDARVGADLEHLSQHRYQTGVVQEVLVVLQQHHATMSTLSVISTADCDRLPMSGKPCCISADAHPASCCCWSPESTPGLQPACSRLSSCDNPSSLRDLLVHRYIASTCVQRTLVVLSHRA